MVFVPFGSKFFIVVVFIIGVRVACVLRVEICFSSGLLALLFKSSINLSDGCLVDFLLSPNRVSDFFLCGNLPQYRL